MARRWVREVDTVKSDGSERAGESWVAALHVFECSCGRNVGTARTLNGSGYSIRLAFPASQCSKGKAVSAAALNRIAWLRRDTHRPSIFFGLLRAFLAADWNASRADCLSRSASSCEIVGSAEGPLAGPRSTCISRA